MTNAVLNSGVLAALLVVAWPTLRRMRGWPVLWTVLHLCVLTAVFDTIMIAADLYVFDPDKILGVHVLGAPVEDFAYAVAAGVAVPVLWTVLGRSARTSSRARAAAAPGGPTTGTPPHQQHDERGGDDRRGTENPGA
ncbi:lycopene cyclase domain-containing protein [Cellulomonas oligotrophica]|uniref:Lycopene cyclase domain-containing protein n=1 Tax=Cellulomonas oligotrophica TaxID=931536 RepID=A0A7Y9JWM1_9CELL|nr:lycopene cyclase domain-containing protein [Cellulomonas oligotrophica]NYD85818.1 lycopene cyclase domain-containing protein [Cellulomonas oligotrophica]GIG31175.1 hypothetical protein Col01nite_03340 [Cellulomonas oligotrophica]